MLSLIVHLRWVLMAIASCGALSTLGMLLLARSRNMQYWIGPYLFPAEPREPLHPEEPINVFIAICDHYEPECYGADRETARARVDRWLKQYPQLFQQFHDSRGRAPQHTFFFPQDEYRPEYLDELKKLCDAGYGDVDIHLHHHNDTAASLRDKLEEFRETLHLRHGLLRRDPQTGEVVYGFIHGNWALCNSLPNGAWCGVDQELTVLLQTGCYADFTFPSAPSPTQPRTINSVYYAQDIPGQCRSHDTGLRAKAGHAAPRDHLLMIPGPLGLDWNHRKLGLVPGIENADLTGRRPPTMQRFDHWVRTGVHVAGKPNWIFIKLHTHGCKETNTDMLLGPAMQAFHQNLGNWAAESPRHRYHYVTAWEMAQLVHAAERNGTIDDVLKPAASPRSLTPPATVSTSMSV